MKMETVIEIKEKKKEDNLHNSAKVEKPWDKDHSR